MEDNVGTIVIGTKVDNKGLEKGVKETEEIVKNASVEKIEVETNLKAMEQEYGNLENSSKEVLDTTSDMSNEIEESANGMSILTEKFGLSAEDVAEMAEDLGMSVEEVTVLAEEMGVVLGTTNAIVTAIIVITVGVIKIGQAIANHIIKRIQMVINTIKKIALGIANIVKGVVKWGFQAFGITSTYNAIHSLITTIVNENETLQNQTLAIKGALANLIEPIITRIVNLIATLLSFFGTLIKQLTGKDLFGGASANLKSAVGSAKELKKQLAGFDEMNVLNDTSSGGGGGSGGGAGGLGEVNKELLGTLNKIKDLILNGDWKNLGKMISDGLVKGIQWVVDKIKNIPWAKIGMAISDFINNIDYSSIFVGLVSIFGEAVLGLQDLLLHMDLAGFFEKFTKGIADAFFKIADYIKQINWIELGKKISEVITSIKWEDMLTGIISIIGEMKRGIADFFINIDWGKVMGTVSGAISSVIEAVTDQLYKTDWVAFGLAVGKIISDIVQGIDWERLILGIIDFITALNVSFNSIAISIMTAIETEILKWLSDPENAKKLLKAVINIINGIIRGIATVIVAGLYAIGVSMLDAIKEFFGIHSPSSVMADEVGKPLGEGIIEGIKALKDKIIETFKNILDGIINKYNEFKNKIKTLIDFAIQWLKNKISEIINNIVSRMENLKSTISNVVQWIKDRFNSIVGFFQGIGIAIGDFFSSAIKSAVNGALSWIEQKINWFIGKINGIIDWVNKLPIGTKISRMSYISLPRMAVGGIINQPGRGVPVGGAIAGESGREGILPLTDKQAMEQLGREIGKWISIQATVPVNIGNRQIARVIQELNNDREFAMNS